MGISFLTTHFYYFYHWCLVNHGEVKIFTIQFKVKVRVTQLCLTLCNPMDCIVHGILLARIPEWAAFPFSRGYNSNSSQKTYQGGCFPLVNLENFLCVSFRPRIEVCKFYFSKTNTLPTIPPYSHSWFITLSNLQHFRNRRKLFTHSPFHYKDKETKALSK